MTEQLNLVIVRVEDLRALWVGDQKTGYLLYVAGIARPFEITSLSAKEIGAVMGCKPTEDAK